jgi:hypothetical protein
MERIWKNGNDFGTLIPGLRIVHAVATTTTSGTIGTVSPKYGMTLTKTATETGRYTCSLLKSDGNTGATALALVDLRVNIVGPDDAAMTDAKGIFQGVIRDNDIATDGTVEFQLQDADSGADAEVQDGATLMVTLLLRDRSA